MVNEKDLQEVFKMFKDYIWQYIGINGKNY